MATYLHASVRKVLLQAPLYFMLGACGLPPSHLSRRSVHDISMSLREHLADGCQDLERPKAAGLTTSLPQFASGPTSGDGLPESALAVVAALSKQLPPGVEARLSGVERSSGAVHHDVRFFAGGRPLCGHPVRVSVLGGAIYGASVGSLAEASAFAAAATEAAPWPSLGEALFRAALELNLEQSSAEVLDGERCLQPSAEGYRPAWQFQALIHGDPYYAVADAEEAYYVEPRSLRATGQAAVHRQNPFDRERVKVKLPDLVGDGRLASSRFITVLANGAAPIIAEDHNFDVAVDDPHYAEVSAFAHAEAMYAWMTLPEHRYSSECLPIEIELHATFNSGSAKNIDNAEYVPAEFTSTKRPRIRLGDGSGSVLRNLALDFDVVGHELAHHVLARRLRSQAGESGVIHEAVADYLLFAQTGNACLGESICPEESSACAVQGQCLRTALNTLKLTDPDLPFTAHQRSQFLSGMLWDIGAHPQVGQATLAKLVFASVSYLQPASGYLDLVKALLLADAAAYGGRHACVIFAGALARGLAQELQGVSCESFVTSNI